jgi:hypothetical protein
MIFVILNPTLAQVNANQKEKAETLLNLIDNSNMSVVEAFSRLEVQNITVPQIAEKAYNEGLNHAGEAFRLENEKMFSEASNEAIKALQKFRETLKILENASPVEPTEVEVIAKEAIYLKANITRSIEYAERLENLTAKAAEAGYTTTIIEKTLSEIKKHLENATRKLDSIDLIGATEELSIAKILLETLKEPIERLTSLVIASKTEKYLEVAEKRVSETIINITSSLTLTSEAKEEAINSLNNSETSLAKARDFIENDIVDEAIKELEEAKKWEEESSRAIASVAATTTTIAPTTESFTRAETTESR